MKERADLGERVRQLQGFYLAHGRMPSYSEIARLLGLRSKNAVFRLVEKLRRLNIIDKDTSGRLIPKNLAARIKLLGTVEAGFPSPAEEELLDRVSLDRWLVTNSAATFLLRVTGDSMSGAGILPGDAVLVDRSLTPKNGDIVIAEVDGAWTMKFFHKEGGKIVLLAANPKYPPIKPRRELKLGGVVTAVIRKYR
ncbi:MAG: transcriptional repressor LexA [candidate division WOR-3 bacterium]|jgi:repressor LexA|nr:transcriptional repressor LexA [candidate division WOR-3 bacterium]MCR4424123.1 transcriptional repressor LexA [candidate division WOR-3 bacterium]MDH7519458.1 transcriptional repressor LexA [bacterium]